MKYMTTFVFCLFRALYQGNDNVFDFPNNLYGEKTKDVWAHRWCTYSCRRGEGTYQKAFGNLSHNRWTVGVRSKRTYGNLCHIGGQWVSGENLLTFLFFRIKSVPQLAEISEFNFNLVLSDIVAIKHLEKALCQVNFFPIICIQAICFDLLTWWSSAFVFQFCLWFVFRLYHHSGQLISSPDLALSVRSVLWQMDVSKWYSC